MKQSTGRRGPAAPAANGGSLTASGGRAIFSPQLLQPASPRGRRSRSREVVNTLLMTVKIRFFEPTLGPARCATPSQQPRSTAHTRARVLADAIASPAVLSTLQQTVPTWSRLTTDARVADAREENRHREAGGLGGEAAGRAATTESQPCVSAPPDHGRCRRSAGGAQITPGRHHAPSRLDQFRNSERREAHNAVCRNCAGRDARRKTGGDPHRSGARTQRLTITPGAIDEGDGWQPATEGIWHARRGRGSARR